MSEQYKFLLDESHLPKAWYNINADMPVPPQPVLHPGTMEPVTPDFLSVLFPMSLILQEISTERYIEIPEPVREIYKLWRPTPLMRAVRLEKALDTPAHIYYKYEGVSPVGSHKPNTAVPQAFYNKEAGTKALTTETGAGQWGSALAMACSFFDIDLEIYMVKVSYSQKPYRRIIMENFGAEVYASPTDRTHAGRAALVAKELGGLEQDIAVRLAPELDRLFFASGGAEDGLGHLRAPAQAAALDNRDFRAAMGDLRAHPAEHAPEGRKELIAKLGRGHRRTFFHHGHARARIHQDASRRCPGRARADDDVIKQLV
jgi:hypothetical protein